MKHGLFVLTAAAILSLSACKKQDDAAPAADNGAASVAPAGDTGGAAAPAGTDASGTAAPAASGEAQPAKELTEAEQERATAQGKLDFAKMEAGYIADPKGQWATSAKASSAYGDAGKPETSQDAQNTPWQATGAVNENSWSSAGTDVGFDWLELGYDKPVNATEVRVAFSTPSGPKSATKVELLDTDGNAHTVWEGLSDVSADERGPRTWFVRKFEATPYLVKGVKVTLANAVDSGYKEIDAVQLVSK